MSCVPQRQCLFTVTMANDGDATTSASRTGRRGALARGSALHWSLGRGRSLGSRPRAEGESRLPKDADIKKGGDAICNVHRHQSTHTHNSRARPGTMPPLDGDSREARASGRSRHRRSKAAGPRRLAGRRSGRSSCSRRAAARPSACAGRSGPGAVASEQSTSGLVSGEALLGDNGGRSPLDVPSAA